MKSKEERERYTQLNANFQRTARREKKAFLNEQRKEVEENNRIGKTRDLFKKIGDIQGTFHARMGTFHAKMSTTKGRNSEALTGEEKIKKRWQEHTEELSLQKSLNDQDNHNG